MLWKFVSTTGKDWYKYLPYILFAYREVPQASMGFSPFELLYRHQVKGPLDVLRVSRAEPVVQSLFIRDVEEEEEATEQYLPSQDLAKEQQQ